MDQYGTLVYAAIILICWLPWLVVFFPGNVYSDGFRMIYDIKNEAFSSWHPLFPALILSALYDLGNTINNNLGVFTIIIVEAVLNLAVYTYLLKKMERMGTSRRLCLAGALFFGIVPLFATISTTVWADAFYLPCFIIFVIKLIDCLLADPAIKTRDALLMALVGVLLCLLRKEGIYVCAATLMVLFVVVKAWEKLKVVGILAILGASYLLSATLGLTTTGVDDDRVSLEMLSIPMQQTARYLATYPDDVSTAEQEIINGVFIYSPNVPIADKYNPWTADAIKGFGLSVPRHDLEDYLAIWVHMGIRHPNVYIDSVLASTYGYYSPLGWLDQYGTGPYEIIKADSYGPGVYDDVFDFEPEYVADEHLRYLASRYAFYWRIIPPLSWLSTPGLYVWILLFLSALLIRRRRFPALVAFVPAFMIFLICLAGPVNGFIRYAAPLLVSAPLLAAFTRYCLHSQNHRLARSKPPQIAE
jgi:hypothetical protein